MAAAPDNQRQDKEGKYLQIGEAQVCIYLILGKP
jgi:hypothetical protein